MDLEHIQRIGLAAAYKGSNILTAKFGRLTQIRKKGAIDLVTEADIESEKAIIETIRSAFPDHGFLAEESGMAQGDPGQYWIIDPLDGTTNFAHGVGLFCISIAFAAAGRIVCGIVLNPISGELFTAVKGEGAFLNGVPISVSSVEHLEESLLVTGFPYNVRDTLQTIVPRVESCLTASQGLRRLGSAALDLCYVACGRFEAFWEEHLKPWDTAAGWLIAEEAGAVSTDFSNRPFDLDKKELLTSNGKIHKEMLALLDLNKPVKTC